MKRLKPYVPVPFQQEREVGRGHCSLVTLNQRAQVRMSPLPPTTLQMRPAASIAPKQTCVLGLSRGDREWLELCGLPSMHHIANGRGRGMH